MPIQRAAFLGMFLLAACGAERPQTLQAQTSQQPAPPPSGEFPRGTLTGKVLETMDSAGYTYIRLQVGERETWAAVRQTPVKVGESISLQPQMTLQNFESTTLNRKFDTIVFAATADAPPPSDAAHPMDSASMHMSSGAADVGDVKVAKAEGGKTIADTWAQREQLAGKQVVVRGKVVKFRPDIMGTNWMHIRDGSGSEAKGDHDLTVTTDEKATVGDVVVVKGTVQKDKDFGAGYVYPVIVEQAKITKG